MWFMEEEWKFAARPGTHLCGNGRRLLHSFLRLHPRQYTCIPSGQAPSLSSSNSFGTWSRFGRQAPGDWQRFNNLLIGLDR